MKFAFPGADLGAVIKKFKCDGNKFHVEYFDGSACDYYCSDPNEAKEIRELMLSQAKERQEKMEDVNFDARETAAFFTQLVISVGLFSAIKTESDILTFVCALATVVNVGSKIRDGLRRRELEKYQMFLEMYDSLDEVNKSEFMKCIEFENYYQKKLNIETVDDFSYGEVKTLYRQLQEQKNNR